MAEVQIPPSIDDARSRALMKLVARLGGLDLVPLLVYRIDSVPESALPYLAWQFDILSPLWQMVAPPVNSIDALTDVDLLTDIDTLAEGPRYGAASEDPRIRLQRELLKRAIPLHRFRGTPSAIKSALKTLGWGNISIAEGETSWNGNRFPAEQQWAVFRVRINLGERDQVRSEDPQIAIEAINFLKPARAWLDSLWFAVPPINDAGPSPIDKFDLGGIAEFEIDIAAPPDDSGLMIGVTEPQFADAYGPITPFHDAHYRNSGITYGAGEPIVADSALLLNGAAVLQGG